MAATKFYIKKDGISATMELHGDEFIVLEGSEACTGWITTNVGGHPRVKELHKELHDQGILQIRGTSSVFTEDYRFSKISHAGGVVNGRPDNGTGSWKLEGTNTTYAEWEADQLTQLDTE